MTVRAAVEFAFCLAFLFAIGAGLTRSTILAVAGLVVSLLRLVVLLSQIARGTYCDTLHYWIVISLGYPVAFLLSFRLDGMGWLLVLATCLVGSFRGKR